MNKQGVFLRAMQSDATEATIDVIGVIGWDAAYPVLRDMIRTIPENVKKVTFDIYSPGGDVWEGNGIVQEIGELGKRVHTVARVQVAASMATLIAVACNERTIAQNGRWLIHNAWSQTTGDAEQMEKMAKTLRDCELEAARFYAARTGKTEAEMLKLMGEERWMMPDECKAVGFVQSVCDPFKPEAFAAVREEMEAAGKWPKALVELPPEPKKEEAQNGGTATEGAKVGECAPVTEPVKPDDGTAREQEAFKKGVEEGTAIGRSGALSEMSEQAAKMADKLAECEKANKELAETKLALEAAGRMYGACEEQRAKLQSEKDKLIAQMAASGKVAEDRINALKEQLGIANGKLQKFIGGALEFSPSIETWTEALAAHGGDYAKARAQYPAVYKAYMAAQRQKDK